MAFCTKCGSKLVEGAAFCGNCGNKVKAAQGVQGAPPPPPRQETAPQRPQFSPQPGPFAHQGQQSFGQGQAGNGFPPAGPNGQFGTRQPGKIQSPGMRQPDGSQQFSARQPGEAQPFGMGQPVGTQQFSAGPVGNNFQQPGFNGYGKGPGFQPAPGMYVPDQGFKEMFLKTSGRMNRKRFFKRILLLAVVFMVVASVLMGIMGMRTYMRYYWLVGLILGIPGLIFTYCLYVRRLQDLNKDNKLAIVTAVIQIITIAGMQHLGALSSILGFVNFIIALYLLVKDGTHGPNQYGPDPLNRMY